MLLKAQQWFSPPTFEDEEKNRIGRALRIILFASLIIIVCIFFLLISYGSLIVNMLTVLVAIALLIAIWFMRRGRLMVASLIVLTAFLGMVVLFPHIDHGIHDTALVAYPTLVVGASVLLNRRLFTVYVVMLILAVGLIAFNEMVTGIIDTPFSSVEVFRDSIAVILIIIITAVPVRLLNDNLLESLATAQENEKILAEANRQLAQQKEAVHASQQQLQLALNAAKMGIWDWDLQANIITWSDEVEPMFGLASGQFSGALEDYLTFIYPDDREMLQEAIQSTLSGETSHYFVQHRVIWPDGTVHWIEGRGNVYFTAQNQPVRMVGTVTDITLRKEVSEALHQSEERYRAFIAQSTEGITRYVLKPGLPIHLPEEAQIEYFFKNSYLAECNDAYAQMYGFNKAHDLIGSRFGERFPHTDENNITYLRRFIRSAYHFRDQESHEIDNQGNDRYFLNNLVGIVEDDKLLHVWGVQRDITDRRKADRQLQTYAASLEQSNQELQNFAYAASHDLREPLRKIQVFGDRLQSRLDSQLDESSRDYLARMQNAASRMDTLIQDLLALARITTEAQPFASINLQQIVEEVLVDLELQLERENGSVTITGLPTLMADATQMRQLFQNLISNALKFHKPNQPPQISVSGAVLPAETRRETLCQIVVADNGIGFDEAYQERIFEAFQRLHRKGDFEGSGIGLAICRRIVERHKGKITAVSIPGEGATFTITLPLSHNEVYPFRE